MIRVSVTAEDIAAGRPAKCMDCPVALALARVTGDSEPSIYERDYTLRLRVLGQTLEAPDEVLDFVYSFDGQRRTDDGRVDTSHPEYDPPGPFAFELPHWSDPQWQAQCFGCEGLFDKAELDARGECKECRRGEHDEKGGQ